MFEAYEKRGPFDRPVENMPVSVPTTHYRDMVFGAKPVGPWEEQEVNVSVIDQSANDRTQGDDGNDRTKDLFFENLHA